MKVPHNTLVMFSGGLDSTGVLKHVLTNTDDVVYAHHVIIQNQEGRHEREVRHARKIARLFKKEYRDFEYSESIYVFPAVTKFFGFDMHILKFIAMHLVMNLDGMRRIALGQVKEDAEEAQSLDVKLRISKDLQHVLENMGQELGFLEGPVELFFPLQHKSKAEVMQFLGRDLTNQVFTCRAPRFGGQVCGRCKSCRHFSRAYQQAFGTKA